MTLASGRRPTLSGSVLAPQSRVRSSRIRGSVNLANASNVYWSGADVNRGSLVQPTGSQTISEDYYKNTLTVSAIASIASADMACLLFPATISIGDIWACQIFVDTSSTNQILVGGLVMTNGTAISSALAGAFSQLNTDNTHRTSSRAGTPEAMASEISPGQLTAYKRSPYLMILQYSAANTFVGSVDIPGGKDPRTFANLTSTQTPTHVGVAWTNWGSAPAAPVIEFGPLVKTN